MLNIVLFGPPGAGKGTQSQNIIKKYDLIHLATGDLLRSEIADQTQLGKEAKNIMARGELVPDHVVIGIIDSRLDKNPDAKGFVFDGFPRTVEQARALDKLLAAKNSSIKRMVALEVDKDHLKQRLILRGKESGRPDDQNEHIIENRIKVYNKTTAPVKDFYDKQSKLSIIDGIGTIDEVFDRICNAIEK